MSDFDFAVITDSWSLLMLGLQYTVQLTVIATIGGVLFGTFSCEQVGHAVNWTPRQLQLLRKIGSRASLALVHAIHADAETAPGTLWEPSSPNRLATMPVPLDDQRRKP